MSATPLAHDAAAVSAAVAKLYDTYPFPPEPLLDEAPPGYNWRWHWPTAHSFCTGRLPHSNQARILDAGCGSGVSTEYLVHLNPEAQVVGLDISAGTLAVAQERCRRSGADNRVTFHHMSLYDVDQLPGEFDLINTVGVLHHLPDPIRGIQALAAKLAPGGLLHIFVYAALGRREVLLMQEAIAMLQGTQRGNYKDGVQVGRQLFTTLPETNRIVQEDKRRWALENHKDECFADMYVHPQETDYTIDTLFELIDASDLRFVGFSNPAYWSIERLIGQSPDLMERVATLSERQRYRLIEILDPELTHYEFFLAREPFERTDWSNDADLLAAYPTVNPCLSGWPAPQIFNPDYQIVTLNDAEYAFMQACDTQTSPQTIATLITQAPLDLANIRALQQNQLILLKPH
jgi:SAM-dependent methyltransferase